MSIRARLLLLVFAVWLPAVAGFGLLARATYVREADAALQGIEQMGRSMSFVVERELDKRAILAQTLGVSAALRSGDLALFHSEASAATFGTDSWAFVITRTSQPLTTLAVFDPLKPLARVPDGPFVISKPEVHFTQRGPFLKKPVIAAFAAVPNAPQEPVYNVGIGFDPAVIQAIVAEHTVPEGGLAAVLNATHLVMARSRDPEKWLGVSATGTLKRRALARESGFAESVTLDGIPSLSYLSPANRYGWFVVISLPKVALTGAAQRVTAQAFAAAGALLLLGLGLALYASRRIGQPLLLLRDAAAQLGQDAVPPPLATGLEEADAVSAVLHAAGRQSQEAKQLLQQRVAQAVEDAKVAQARLLDGQKHEAIGRLTGGLAHDFNNLLQTITISMQMVKRGLPEGQQRRAMESGIRACGKAADLVRQMLTFGRATPLEPRPTSLSDLLLKTQELASKALTGRIEMTAAVEPGLPPLLVDPTQLELALLNLIFNARDAMPEGGKIRIVGRLATTAEGRGLGDGAFACVAVSDTGQGMTPETLARALEPYFTTKPVGAGSGLGLAQVHALARQSGGELTLRSALGEGTTVSLLLPTCRAEISTEQVAAPTVAVHPLVILMVEDDVLAASVVAPALEAAGHRVTLCATADDACQILQGPAQFDVLFTDVVMPGTMTGIDLVAWARIHRPSLPAVVATGYTAQHLDADLAVLRKPYEIDALLLALRMAADSGRPPRPI